MVCFPHLVKLEELLHYLFYLPGAAKLASHHIIVHSLSLPSHIDILSYQLFYPTFMTHVLQDTNRARVAPFTPLPQFLFIYIQMRLLNAKLPTCQTVMWYYVHFSLLSNLSSFSAISSAAASNDDSTDVVLVKVLMNFPKTRNTPVTT